MNRHIKKCIISTALFISLFFYSVLTMGQVCAAENTKLEIKTDKAYLKPGDIAVVSVVTTETIKVAAFDMKIDLDTDVFSVVKVAVDESISQIYYGVQEDRIYLNWVSDKNVTLNSGTILSVSLRVSQDAAWKDYEIGLSEVEFYDAVANKISTEMKSVVANFTIGSTKSNLVLTAENAIADIGKVEPTVECLERITKALEAFHAIKPANDKTLVENYGVLQTAINTYNRLREESALEDREKEVTAQVKQFQTKHQAVLKLTEKIVTVSDGTAINAALDNYATLDPYIRKQLQEEYQQLLLLKNKVKELEDALEEAELADMQVKQFYEYYANVLKYSKETIPVDGLEEIKDSKNILLSALSSYDAYNEMAQKKLKKEYKHLNELLDYVMEQEIQNAEEPAWVIESYNAFIKKYMTLLIKTEGEITEDDLPTIRTALSELRALKPQVKGKLIAEFEQLMNFMNAANQSEMDGLIQSEVQEIEKIVEVEKWITVETKEDGEKAIRVLGVEMSAGVWFGFTIFIMMLTSVILYLLPFVAYFVLKRRRESVLTE